MFRFIFLFSLLSTVTPIVTATSFEEALSAIEQQESKSTQIQQLKALAKKSSLTNEQKYQVLKQLIFTQFNNNELEQAKQSAIQTADYAGKKGLLEQEAEAFKLVGAMHYYLGEHQAAINAYQTSHELYQPLNLAVSSANVLNNLGLVYSDIGEHIKALDYYQQADKLYQAHGSEADKLDIKHNIAGLHIKLDQFDVAINILTELENAYKTLAEQKTGLQKTMLLSDLALVRANLAVALKHATHYELARNKALQSLKYFREIDNTYNQAIQLHNLSDIYFYLKQPAAAISYANQAVETSRSQNNQRVLAGALYTQAKGFFYRNQYQQALEKITEADKIANKINYQVAMTNNHGLRALIYAAQQNPEASIAEYQTFVTRTNAHKNDRLNEQLAKFESERLAIKIQQLEASKHQQQIYNNQIRIYLFIGFVFCLVIIFMAYRKYLDGQMQSKLENMIKRRTKQLQFANQQLLDLSLLDSITQVHNHYSFEKDFERLWHEKQTVNEDFLLIFTDIDYFKQFNEHYGHNEGDNALKQIAKAIQDLLRDSDRVYRYGSESFAIIMTNHNLSSAKTTFERIQKATRQLNISNQESEHRVLTLSAGISQSSEVKSPTSMIELADKRLHQAKILGRNCLIDKLAG